MPTPSRKSALLCAVVAALAIGCGATARFRGHVAADGRLFLMSNRYPRQAGGSGGSLVAEPELSVQDEDREHTLTIRPFLRLDPYDPNRLHWDVRQADYVLTDGEWELALGQGVFSWGPLEALRLVDVLNQRDLVEDIDMREKMGQPYVRGGLSIEGWTLRLYVLPYFRERTFPGTLGRLRTPLVVDVANPVYESALGAWHPNVAARAQLQEGDVDLGISAFSGTDREPRLLAQISDDAVVPGYVMVQQASVDVSITLDETVLKLETVGRLYFAELEPSVAVAGGLEHTFYDVDHSGVDVTLALEGRYDHRPRRAPFTFFDHDVFAGLRVAFNDAAGTELRAGAVTDVVTGFTFVTAQASTRLDEHFRLSLDARFFAGADDGQLEASFLNDQYLELRIAYHL